MNAITFTQAIRETLAAEMRRDPSVFLMGEDIGVYGGAFGVTRGLIDAFGPSRVRNTPISEQAITGIAIGAAVAGQRPVIEIMFMDFITLAVDQLVNMAAKLRPIYGLDCPLVLRTPPGGGRGYGATHSQSLERLFTGVPGLKIAAPSNARDASGLLQTAIRDNGPVLFLEHKLLYPLRFANEALGVTSDFRLQTSNVSLSPPIPFGTANCTRPGNDVTIIAWSYMAYLANQAAAQLEQNGVDAEVIDLLTLAPLDIGLIVDSVKNTGRVLIVEEGPKTGGFAAEIAAQIMEQAHDYLEKPVRRLASPDCPFPSAKHLEAACIPTVADIVREATNLL
ncbi:MAG: alpha-ketoacid dehydrogenase subunit beta [Kiritimatiellaeota bacterium]|nr:alpha-ketoacid dehydrogenase subunit beta [Kiritimatiellota bacterium]